MWFFFHWDSYIKIIKYTNKKIKPSASIKVLITIIRGYISVIFNKLGWNLQNHVAKSFVNIHTNQRSIMTMLFTNSTVKSENAAIHNAILELGLSALSDVDLLDSAFEIYSSTVRSWVWFVATQYWLPPKRILSYKMDGDSFSLNAV